MNYEEGTIENLEHQRKVLSDQQRTLRQQLGENRAHRFEFQYTDPERNFDRRRVKGMVCTLFDVRDHKYGLALSMCAGGSVSTIFLSSLEKCVNNIAYI